MFHYTSLVVLVRPRISGRTRIDTLPLAGGSASKRRGGTWQKFTPFTILSAAPIRQQTNPQPNPNYLWTLSSRSCTIASRFIYRQSNHQLNTELRA